MDNFRDIGIEIDSIDSRIRSCQYLHDMLEAHGNTDRHKWKVSRRNYHRKGEVGMECTGVAMEVDFPVQELVKVNPQLKTAWDNFWQEMIKAYSEMRNKSIQKLKDKLK